ncbi:cellulose synthase subunit BcsC-related outer membrane protein [Psychromonas sp. SP041]|uniref:cellulose synthase subunit BcsC-related outer membrane protein n=1 Tax=Psychromonas sp. SP041 TaxID=1365007 RepID=UPI0003F69766|nr:cellulose synthase subunit BcsC-related outer membrane protein [Psychromonas sp. SP041]
MNIIKLMFLSFLSFTSANISAADAAVEYKTQNIIIQRNSYKQQIELAQKEPDTSDFWFHIHREKGAQAQQELNRLRQLTPSWQPDEVMLNALAYLNKPKKIYSKKKSSLFYRIGKGNEAYWQAMSTDLFERASALAFKQDKSTNNNLMGWVSVNRKEYQLAIEHFNKVKGIDTEEGLSAAISGLVHQAVNDDDKKLLSILLKRYPQQPIIKQIQSQAWDYHQEKQYQLALNWFEFTDDHYAQVLTLDKMERKQEASDLACKHTSELELLNYCVNHFSIKQLDFFEQQQYQKSLAFADKIEQYQTLNNDQLKLSAWSHYHLGHKNKSILLFKKLITQEPGNQSYASTLTRLIDTDDEQLVLLAQQYPSIAIELKNKKQQTAWGRKQFDRFYGLEDEQKAEQQWIVETGIDWRFQESDDALANLDSQHYYLGFSKYKNEYRFGMRVNYQGINGDDPSVGDDFWQDELISSFDQPSSFSETGLSAYLKRQGSNINTLAELEYWKSNDGLTSSLTGKLSAVWFLPKWVVASTLYRERVEDSLLSSTGVYSDQDISESWGAVIANGIKGVASYSFEPNWSISTELDAAVIRGEQVQDNKKLALQLSLVRNLPNVYPEQLDYLRVGPSISWMSYDKNLNYYTEGNGGYYSPESYVSVGGQVELLTIEDKRWQVKSRMNLGYFWSNPGDIDRFPSAASSNSLSQESDSGIAAEWLIEGQWLFNRHWEIAGLVSSSVANSYNETRVAVQLRWNFMGKSSVTSDGLISSSPYDADYAWY